MMKELIVTAVGCAAVATGGAAYAGALPGAAQDTASTVLASVGVSVPGADEHSAGHADTRGRSGSVAPTAVKESKATTETADNDQGDDQADDRGDDQGDQGTTGSQGKGAEVSALAKSTTSEGVAKGAEISTFASGGKSRAGQHGAHGSKPGPNEHSGDHANGSSGGSDDGDESTGAPTHPSGPPAVKPGKGAGTGAAGAHPNATGSGHGH